MAAVRELPSQAASSKLKHHYVIRLVVLRSVLTAVLDPPVVECDDAIFFFPCVVVVSN